jgi:hypothetical protein
MGRRFRLQRRSPFHHYLYLLIIPHRLENLDNVTELTKLTKLILSSSSFFTGAGLSGSKPAVSRILHVTNLGSKSMPDILESICDTWCETKIIGLDSRVVWDWDDLEK